MTKSRPGRPRVRLFVALDLPEQIVLALSVWRSTVYGDRPEFRLPDAQALHVTLVFLGYQYERDVARIAELAFADPIPQPLELTATEIVGLPPARARLHALELEDSAGRLVEWQREVAGRLERERLLRPEKRPFRPHVTVARGKRGREREVARAPVPELPGRLRGPFRADRATLFSSLLAPSGAVYERLAGIDLKQ